jgi:hypothetical protein
MIGYFFLGVLVLVLLLLLIRAVIAADPAVLAGLLKGLAVALVGGGVLFLLIVGRAGLAGTMLGVAGPLLLLWLRRGGFRSSIGGSRPGAGGSSNLETAFLAMTLDHATGALDGRVKRGRFAGRRLGELSPPQLIELLAEVRAADAESATVLEAYLDRTQGADWRREAGAAGSARNAGAGATPPPAGGPMTREEAYAVLGLKPGATADEVRDAHHRLMKKLHPDQGGSDYLAARVNQARDILLES